MNLFSSRRLMSAVGATVATMLMLAGCSSSADEPSGSTEAAELTVGVTPIPNAAPLYLAEDLGYFAEEGLEVTPQVVASAGAAVPLLQSGDLQFAVVSAAPTITAASKGLPFYAVAGNDRYNADGDAVDGAALVASANSGLTDMSGLDGKTVAIVGLKSAPELVTRKAIDDAGGDSSSVNFVEIAYPDMVAALESDRVDAALIVDPFLGQVRESGLAVIGQPFIDAMPGEAGTLWIGSGQWMEQHSDSAAGFQRAISKAVDYARENPDAVREIMSAYTKSSPEAIEQTVLPIYDSSVTADDMQSWSDAMVGYGFIEGAYDPSDLVWKP